MLAVGIRMDRSFAAGALFDLALSTEITTRTVRKIWILLAWILSLQLFAHSAAFAAEPGESVSGTEASQTEPLESTMSTTDSKIRQLDRQIILELVELDRFNIRYRLQVAQRARWRKVVYPLGQEAGAAALTAAVLVGIRQTTRGWNNPGLISKTAIRKSLGSATVGSVFGGTSSAVELLADGIQCYQERRRGFSSERAVAFQKTKLNNIEALLASRDKLMEDSTVTGDRRELLELKGHMSRYIRDRLVAEFEQWYAQAHAVRWYRNTFYVMNVISNFTRLAATQLGFRALKKPAYGGGIGPTQLAASGVATVAPVLSIAISHWVKKRQERRVSEKLGAAPPISNEEIEQHFQLLSELLAKSGELDERTRKVMADISLLRKHTLDVDQTILRESREILRLRGVADQRLIAGPIIGSLGVAAGTLATIGFHAYRDQPKINTRLGLPGGLLGLSAGSIALYLTPQGSISAFFYERSLRQKGQHPRQLLAKRLADLDRLEAAIKSISP